MRTAVIFTGGTIGSCQTGEVISTDRTRRRLLLEKCRERTGVERDFMEYDPYTVLSENMSGREINLLVDCIFRALDAGAEGIIVTHGTDTLQYTACLLSYLLGADTPPVVLVSANYPLDDARSNGTDNFAAAVDFVEHGYGRGVFVAYKNRADDGVKMHRASRLLPCTPYSDDTRSVEDCVYGEYRFNAGMDTVLQEQTAGMGWRFKKNSSYRALADQTPPVGSIRLHEQAQGLLWIRPYTGLVYPMVTDGVKAVLHESFHSGTMCTEGDAVSAFAASLKEKKIPLYLTGGIAVGAQYGSTQAYGALGVKMLPAASPVAMYCKLWLALEGGLPEDFLFASLGEDILPDARR